MRNGPIRVLIVDDSALVRKVVSESLKPFPDIQVVGTAMDPYIARDKIRELKPDVLTLDIEMPRMDGLTFLKLLMQHHPMPVIVMSSLTQAGSALAVEALEAGAVEVLSKPGSTYSAHEDGARLAASIRAAAASRPGRLTRPAPVSSPTPRNLSAYKPLADLSPAGRTLDAGSIRPKSPPGPGRPAGHFHPRQLILLGASTGGTEALRVVLESMSADLPGICIVQHIPAGFSKALADRLNSLCAMEVREARSGDTVRAGLALLAPGGWHMILRWQGAHYVVELNQGPPVHHQRPAVDILFESAVRAGGGPYAAAALLTGMGADGAAGLLKLRQAGARTIAQNEQTCVVFGMPKEAIRLGAARDVLPLESIGPRLAQLCHAWQPQSATAACGASDVHPKNEPSLP